MTECHYEAHYYIVNKLETSERIRSFYFAYIYLPMILAKL
jgi:hypothetical protein